MKSPVLTSLAIAAAASAGMLYLAPEPRDVWTFTIQDLAHKPVGTLRVRFTYESAKSCRAGPWKKVALEGYTALGEPSFPGTAPLSYRIEGQTLTIGANEICDAYVGLTGQLVNGHMEGDYFWWGDLGTGRLGYVVGKSEHSR